jgi:uncharacterized protein YihD (DUF1040 family)
MFWFHVYNQILKVFQVYFLKRIKLHFYHVLNIQKVLQKLVYYSKCQDLAEDFIIWEYKITL